MKKLLLGSATLLLVSAAPVAAQAQDYGMSASIDYVSEYVFRGVSFEGAAIQPGVEVSIGDFAVGAWGSAGFGEDSLADTDELDLYASYGFTFSDIVSASVGATYYTFPDASNSLEFSAGIALDTALAPSLTAYYDIDLEAFTLEGSIGHSFPAGEKTSFDLGLTAGLVDGPDGSDYEYGTASASLGYGFTDDFSGYIGANYSLSSVDSLGWTETGATTKDNLLWFGVGVGAGF